MIDTLFQTTDSPRRNKFKEKKFIGKSVNSEKTKSKERALVKVNEKNRIKNLLVLHIISPWHLVITYKLYLFFIAYN